MFCFDGIAASDLATLLSEQKLRCVLANIAPNLLPARLGEHTTLRLFFAPYNSPQDVDAFCGIR